MSKLLFLPISITSGILAGLLGRKAFEAIWSAVDDQEPPKAEHRRIAIPKLILALSLEGALFRLLKGLVDHASRKG
ncbi:MAG TPA: DUF4235 domain-containing protein, partial [Solirubrobacteraceae bacterium]